MNLRAFSIKQPFLVCQGQRGCSFARQDRTLAQ